MQTTPSNHDFVVVAETTVKSLNALAIEMRHTPSGARILHIACPDRENCFCVAVPTPPPDDTGMPHILEHMTLAGSEKFRCKEPFFEMIKRSVATFINALTGNDITYYPVCSTVKADLLNLADVYFDAVFHPLLSDATFRREAYHLSPADPAKPLGALRYDGIVYSEMKGVFSSPEGILERDSVRRLLPDTCHGKESGGNPESIPSLTPEALRAFHATRYNPSNAFIILYGDIPTEDWLAFLAPRLAGYTPTPPLPPPVRQPRWDAPRTFSSQYPLPADEDEAEKTYLMLNWLVGDTTDLAFCARLSILAYLLTGNDAAPLKKAVTDSHVGANVVFAGSSPYGQEMCYHLAIDGSEPDRLGRLRDVVFSTLRDLAQRPFDPDDVAAAFQQTVYSCNEIGSQHAFTTVVGAATAWCAGLDPAALLDRAPFFDRARAEIEADPTLLPRMVRELFIDNPHRLDIVLAPSHTLEKEQDDVLRTQLDTIRAGLSDADCARIAEEAAELEAQNARPNTPDDLACLPTLHVSDIPPVPPPVLGLADHERTPYGGTFLSATGIPTNDIVYLTLSFDIRGLPEDLWRFVPRYVGAVSDFGTRGLDFAAVAKRRACCTGGLHASEVIGLTATPDATPLASIDFFLKTTVSSLDPALDVLHEAVFTLDPDDAARMADILVEDRAALRTDFVQDARGTTRIHASRLLSLTDSRKNAMGGLPQLELLERLAAADPSAAFRESAGAIGRIRDFLLDPRRVNASLVAPAAVRGKVLARLARWLDEMRAAAGPIADISAFTPALGLRNEGLSAALQVSFSALCAPAPHISSPDSLPLSVGTSIISTDYMLPEIRFKGNAYGAAMGYAATPSKLIFSSYRDPHIAETFETMLRAPAFVRAARWNRETVDNAILTVAKGFERPLRPAAACTAILSNWLCGRTDEIRAEEYARLLALKPGEVQDTTLRILEESLPHAAYCVAASEAALKEAAARIPGLTITPIVK